MVSSLTHMLTCIKGIKLVAQTNNDVKGVSERLKVKKLLFVTSLVSTAGLVGFFLEHRYLCHDMGKNKLFTHTDLTAIIVLAFSWFAFCEYVVALANMAFHVTVILDFPTEQLIVARGFRYSKYKAN